MGDKLLGTQKVRDRLERLWLVTEEERVLELLTVWG